MGIFVQKYEIFFLIFMVGNFFSLKCGGVETLTSFACGDRIPYRLDE